MGKKNGNMNRSPDKAEIWLFEVPIKGVGLYLCKNVYPKLFLNRKYIPEINVQRENYGHN